MGSISFNQVPLSLCSEAGVMGMIYAAGGREGDRLYVLLLKIILYFKNAYLDTVTLPRLISEPSLLLGKHTPHHADNFWLIDIYNRSFKEGLVVIKGLRIHAHGWYSNPSNATL